MKVRLITEEQTHELDIDLPIIDEFVALSEQIQNAIGRRKIELKKYSELGPNIAIYLDGAIIEVDSYRMIIRLSFRKLPYNLIRDTIEIVTNLLGYQGYMRINSLLYFYLLPPIDITDIGPLNEIIIRNDHNHTTIEIYLAKQQKDTIDTAILEEKLKTMLDECKTLIDFAKPYLIVWRVLTSASSPEAG